MSVKHLGVAVVCGLAVFAGGCGGGGDDWRVVEQFDNGPAGGPPGASEGLKKVRKGDHPTPGKNWKEVDPASLTAEERRELGLDEARGARKRDRGAIKPLGNP